MRSLLITGGTGFLGRALARRLLADERDTDRICIYSRDEAKQAAMRAELPDPDGRLRWFVGCVRDLPRLRRAMDGVEAVISAAALKRVETSEENPTEVIATNVIGAMNVLEAAREAGVKKIMGISTDKAPAAVNVYGATKFLMERLFVSANNSRGAHGPISSCCRYGNIANSTFSVIPKWRSMIARGAKRVPCTDPECTRYWMRVSEATDLILDSMKIMHGGEVFIPTLPAYRLGDLAEAMGVEIEITGLPGTEKQHETMDGVTTSETARRMTVDELRSELAML